MSDFEEFLIDNGIRFNNGYVFFRDRFEYKENIYYYEDIVNVKVLYHNYKYKVLNNKVKKHDLLRYEIDVDNGISISLHRFDLSPHSICIKYLLTKSYERRCLEFVDKLISLGFFEYGLYKIYSNGNILYNNNNYSLKDIEFKNGVYILEHGGVFSNDITLEINNNYDVVLELLNIIKDEISPDGKEKKLKPVRGGEYGDLWKLAKAAASSVLDLKLIQRGADQVLLDAGFNILSLNKKIRKAADLEVRNYFHNEADGASITFYEAAILKICLIYEVAKEVGDKRLINDLICTGERLQLLGRGKIGGLFFAKFHLL